MRTKIQKTTFVFAIILLMCVQVQAQRSKNHQSNREPEHQSHRGNNYHSNNDHNHHQDKHDHCSRSHHDYGRYYNSHRGNYGPPAWSSFRHARHTRYIYFRDYDVYYDYNRNTYVTISGRNWSVSASLPQPMYSVNMNNVVYEEVNYPGDNVYEYHAHRYYGRR